jgi:predicted ester cyclase
MRGKAAARPYLQAWYTAFPDLKSKVTNRIVTEDQVATEIEFTGTNQGSLQFSPAAPAIPPTRKQVRGKGTYFLRIRDGKIYELHTYPDTMGLMMQLGLMGQPNG